MNLTTVLTKIFSQVGIPGSGIVLDLPNYGGLFNRGIFSAIGQSMSLFMGFLVVVWVGFSIYGSFGIVSSWGDPQKIEKGWKTIKSVWIGISYFLLFFVIISLLGVFVGIGAPWNWADNLQQCARGGPAAGRFYFQGRTEGDQRLSYMQLMNDFRANNVTTGALTAYVVCCEDGDRQWIDIVRYQSAAPSGCSINSSKNLQGVPTNVCQGTGASCSTDGDCCSGNCALSGGGQRCAP